MKGRAPIRRTLQYLQRGKLLLNNSVRIVTVNYNNRHRASKGLSEFVFWNLPQLQYKNEGVQIVTFKNMTPSPFIMLYLIDGTKILIDADSKTRAEIHDHMLTAYCSERTEVYERVKTEMFGKDYIRQCMCEVTGQVPCPGYVELPKELRGKYKKLMKTEKRQ